MKGAVWQEDPGPAAGAQVGAAGSADDEDLALLLWHLASPGERDAQTPESLAEDLARWRRRHVATHVAFLGRLPGTDAVGTVWLALVPRAPRPGDLERSTADLQSLFVLPAHRRHGLGSALVRAATDVARERGAARVTVQASAASVPLYERLGFRGSGLLLARELP